MTLASYVEQLLIAGESRRVEFRASVEPMQAIAQTVCSFLNTDGGLIIAGVDPDGTPNGSVDEAQARELQRFLRKQITPGVLADVAFETTGDHGVIVVSVPAGPDRPYVVGPAVFVRKGTATRAADAKTLRALVEEQAIPATRWERRPSVGFELDDVDRELLAETVRRATSGRGFCFEDAKDPLATLAQPALLQSGQLTNAADVLFGKAVARRHPQTRLRVVRYATDRADDFLDEAIHEGPAFGLLEHGMDFLKRHVAVGAVFHEGRLKRETRPAYPFPALREGLVNALVHRDYAAFSGGVAVSVYPDRVEIWNSGRLPRGLSPRDLVHTSHPSILVNPDIAHVFYLHELMERVGRGTYMIARECRQLGTRPPVWKNLGSGVRLTLFAARADQPAALELNDRQKALMEALEVGEPMSLSGYMELIQHSVSERQARRDLAELEGHGYLIRHGAGPKTVYERVERNR